jgi:cell division protein ZapA
MQSMQNSPEEGTLPITVWLAGRSYRLRIKPEEESEVRKAVRLADQKINELRTHYSGKDDQDFLAMCLLMYAGDSAIDVFNNPLLSDELNKMTRRIDKALGSVPDTE